MLTYAVVWLVTVAIKIILLLAFVGFIKTVAPQIGNFFKPVIEFSLGCGEKFAVFLKDRFGNK